MVSLISKADVNDDSSLCRISVVINVHPHLPPWASPSQTFPALSLFLASDPTVPLALPVTPYFVPSFGKYEDFPGGSDGKASVYNAGDPGLIPGLGRSPGECNGNPLQYYCLENPMDRGAWWLQSMGTQRVAHDWVTSLSVGIYDWQISAIFRSLPLFQQVEPGMISVLLQNCAQISLVQYYTL